MKKENFKSYLLFLLTGAAVVLILLNFNVVWAVLEKIFAVLSPFIAGLIIAYVVNMPYNWLYHRAFAGLGDEKNFKGRIRKPLSLILSFLFFGGVIAFVICIIVPELSKSIGVLQENMDDYIVGANKWLENVLPNIGYKYSGTNDLLKPLNDFSKFLGAQDINSLASDFMKLIFPQLYDITKNITMTLYNTIISTVVSVYLLASKEKLLSQSKKLMCALLKEKQLKYLFKVGRTSNEMISRFICGKVIDSAIIGVLCFIGLAIFKFDFAGLISIVIGITNIIPFFGPIIGAVPCTILLLLVNPIKALWFIVFIFVLQQIDGNILGPKILGETIGMDGVWIMFGVLIGGGLFGPVGMVLGVPVLAVIYLFVSEHVSHKLEQKNCTVHAHIIDYNGETIRTSSDEKRSTFANIFRRKKSTNKTNEPEKLEKKKINKK